MSRNPKVNECPDHYAIAFEVIGILRPLNSSIDGTTDTFTKLSLVVDRSEEHDYSYRLHHIQVCVFEDQHFDRGLILRVPGHQPRGSVAKKSTDYSISGSLREMAIEVAYRMIEAARSVVPQGGEE